MKVMDIAKEMTTKQRQLLILGFLESLLYNAPKKTLVGMAQAIKNNEY